MSSFAIGIIGLGALVVMLLLGMPVGFSMLIVGAVGCVVFRGPTAALQIVASDLFTNFASYTMSVAPMFALMGIIASVTGLGSNLYTLANKFLGHKRGGLAMGTVVACTGFGAICGSMSATIVTFGTVAYPEMKKFGYDPKLTCGSLAAGAGLAVLIPPSMTLIVYGIAAEQSIGKLFMGGVFTGILLMMLYIITIAIMLKADPKMAPIGERVPMKERFKALKDGGIIEIAIVFVISLGGLFAGWFTPTESGAIGATGIFLITLIERKLDWQKFKEAMRQTTNLTAMTFLMLTTANVFGRFFALTGIPKVLGAFVAGLTLPHWVTMLVIILIYLVMGCFIDAIAMILLTIPIFLPIVTNTLGFDPIWFGVVLVLVVTMGALTPPVGANVYVLKGVVKEVPMGDMFKGVWPFVGAILVCITILIAFPSVVTFLPNLVY